MATTSKITPYGGWPRNLRLANDAVELITSLEVGPRVLSYRTTEGKNVFKNFPEELGQSNEEHFVMRGGHRLWIAPEDEPSTYHKDNQPVEYCPTCDGGATFISTQTDPFSLEKRLTLHLDDTTSRVTIEHCVTNKGRAPLTLASWGITVVEPGGIAIIPQPELGEHPRDFSPNRNLVLWPYTDLADDRYTFGSRYIFLRQEEERQPTKIGLFHREQWVAYIWENSLFLKSIECIPEATYPDAGCNFETFTNSAMLELESLSPLTTLAPGGSVSHRENWHLFDLSDPVEIQSEDSLREWLFPFLVQAGYSG